MVIQHNMLAAYASMQSNKNTSALAKSTAKLSSGYKVNSAADNAAALSISEGMRSQIRGLNKASNNIQDGISYVQVADGALGEVQDMLQRINELAVQSSNDVNTPEDRAAINAEISQIRAEMNRVFSDTEFNTRKIWDVDNANKVQTGTEEKDVATYNSTFNMPITDDTKGIFPNGAVNVNTITPSTTNPELSAMQLTWTGYDGKTYTSDPIDIPKDTNTFTYDYSEKVKCDGVPIDLKALGGNLKFQYTPDTYAAENYSDLVRGIGSSYFYIGENTSEKVQVSTATQTDVNQISIPGTNSTISFTGSINYGAQYNAGQKFSDTNPDDDFIRTSGAGKGAPDVSNQNTKFTGDGTTNSFGFVLGDSTAASAVIAGIDYRSYDIDSDGYWWDYNDRGNKVSQWRNAIEYGTTGSDTWTEISKMLSGDATHKSILTGTDGHGGIIDLDYNIMDGTNYYGSLKLRVNVSSTDASSSITPNDFLNNLKTAIDSIDKLDFISENSASNKAQMSSGSVGAGNNKYNAPLYEAKQSLMIQSGALGNQGIEIQYESLRDYTLGIRDTDVTTYDGAQKAIGDVANALEIVSAQRSTFGAYQNRLEHAYNVDTNTSENTQSAESKLRDTDMGKEMVEMSKHNILMQSAQSMMMQANQTPQHILDLLS